MHFWTFPCHAFDIGGRLLNEKRVATELLDSQSICPNEIAYIMQFLLASLAIHQILNFCMSLIFLQPENLTFRSEQSEVIAVFEMAMLVHAFNLWPMNSPDLKAFLAKHGNGEMVRPISHWICTISHSNFPRISLVVWALPMPQIKEGIQNERKIYVRKMNAIHFPAD
jgi:hypothetical protein